MTCTRYEKDLALYVEHDLTDADAAAVEAHLRECPTCPSFLAELRASQAQLKDLASEEMEAEALAGVRARLVMAAAAQRPRHDGQVPTWAAAAAIVLALGAVLWIIAVARGTDPARTVAVSLPPQVAPPAIPSPAAAEPSPRSTRPDPPAVSPHMERARARRGRTDRQPPAPALSPDDADQLARAVVAIARIRSVQDVRPDVEPSLEPTPLMRLATADPDVVIYWQLDPNGGE
jgi:anti-sigma factor RsiW